MPEFVRAREQVSLAILPIGSLEQHGPHLPLGLDAMHALALASQTARERPCLVAPPISYGLCRSSHDHPGTVGISGSVLSGLVHDIGMALWRQGIRGLCLLTGHASPTHRAFLVDAGEGLLADTGLTIAVVCVLDLLEEAAELIECPRDSHAGEVETSLAMHLCPQLIKGSAPEEYPSFPKFLLVRDKQGHWPGGVWGDPSKASAEKGRRLFELESQALARVLEDMEAAVKAGN